MNLFQQLKIALYTPDQHSSYHKDSFSFLKMGEVITRNVYIEGIFNHNTQVSCGDIRVLDFI